MSATEESPLVSESLLIDDKICCSRRAGRVSFDARNGLFARGKLGAEVEMWCEYAATCDDGHGIHAGDLPGTTDRTAGLRHSPTASNGAHRILASVQRTHTDSSFRNKPERSISRQWPASRKSPSSLPSISPEGTRSTNSLVRQSSPMVAQCGNSGLSRISVLSCRKLTI